MEKNKHNKHSPTNARIFKTRVWGHTTYYRSLEGTQVQYNETLPDYFQMLQSEPKIAYFQNHEKLVGVEIGLVEDMTRTKKWKKK